MYRVGQKKRSSPPCVVYFFRNNLGNEKTRQRRRGKQQRPHWARFFWATLRIWMFFKCSRCWEYPDGRVSLSFEPVRIHLSLDVDNVALLEAELTVVLGLYIKQGKFVTAKIEFYCSIICTSTLLTTNIVQSEEPLTLNKKIQNKNSTGPVLAEFAFT